MKNWVQNWAKFWNKFSTTRVHVSKLQILLLEQVWYRIWDKTTSIELHPSPSSSTVTKANLKSKWRGICLSVHHLEEILHSADDLNDVEEVAWLPFVLAASVSIAPHPTVESWCAIQLSPKRLMNHFLATGYNCIIHPGVC